MTTYAPPGTFQDLPNLFGRPSTAGGLAQLLSPLRQIATSLPNQIKSYTQREIQSALDQQQPLQTPSPDPMFTDPDEGIMDESTMPVDQPAVNFGDLPMIPPSQDMVGPPPDIFNPPSQQLPGQGPPPMPGSPFMGGIFGGNAFQGRPPPGFGMSGMNRAQLAALFAARQRQQPMQQSQGMPSPIAGLPSIFNNAAGAM